MSNKSEFEDREELLIILTNWFGMETFFVN